MQSPSTRQTPRIEIIEEPGMTLAYSVMNRTPSVAQTEWDGALKGRNDTEATLEHYHFTGFHIFP